MLLRPGEEFAELTSESEDEESKAENLVPASAALLPAAGRDPAVQDIVQQNCADKDLVLQEVLPEEGSRILPNKASNLRLDTTEEKVDLTVNDIEETQITQRINENLNLEGPDDDSDVYYPDRYKANEEENQTSFMEPAVYTPEDYANDVEMKEAISQPQIENQNSCLMNLVQSNEEAKINNENAYRYEKLIESAILKLEHEETEKKLESFEFKTEVAKPSDEKEEQGRLTDTQIEELKKKCLSRMKDNQNTPLVVNPPVLREFSNSQKLMNYLDETEANDRTILNSVKRSSYNMQAQQKNAALPSLSELLTKSVAELSEEVMTLKLELETERRSCAVLRTGLEQQQRTATEKSKQLGGSQ